MRALAFYGGAPTRLESFLGLIKPDDQKIRIRAVLVVLIGWIPLAVLAAIQDWMHGGNSLRLLLVDFGGYARYVVAAPLFIVAESFCFPRFERIILHFRNSGIVSGADRERYEAIVASSARLLNSRVAEVAAFVLAYVVAGALVVFLPSSYLPKWHLAAERTGAFSIAGVWHTIVSVPLLSVLLFGWVWRQILWSRFLCLVAGLDLQIIAAHPDGSGGLNFISTSIRGYWPLGFAFASIAAGGIANRIVHNGASPVTYRYIMIGVVFLIGLLFVLPLGIFGPVLRRAQARAIFEYGTLAQSLGSQFEHRWLPRRQHIKPDVLEVTDFSATIDLYSTVERVYSMAHFPISLRTVRDLLLMTALPFVPVILTAVPVATILDSIVKLLI